MKYFLLCALVIAGAFFSHSYANSNPPSPAAGGGVLDEIACPNGGMYISDLNGERVCYISATPVEPYRFGGGGSFGEFRNSPTDACQSWASARATTARQQNPSWTGASGMGEYLGSFVPWGCKANISATGVRADGSTFPIQLSYTSEQAIRGPMAYQCDNPAFPIGPALGLDETNICYHIAPTEECDCSNFAGQSLNTRNTLRAPKGQYTNENPPQCVMQQEFVAGRDTPLTCTCQVSAQKWMRTNSGFENGVEYERWETLPTTQGQPSGTFTGVKCGATDGGPLEPEDNAPKECFTLPNGVRWCWADKTEKCQVVNGVEQCASGCGTVNGDFVCYDDKPVIPPKDRDQLTPPDDTLTDPNKPINEMVKSDFKEVNKGVETRLDNVVTSISNTTIAMDEVSDKVGLTNSKLDGIGMQLDGVGKQLGAIDGKLEGAFGDKGQPMPGTGDGKNCHEEVCSWYESAYPDGLVGIWEERSLALQQTALFDFINQFSFEPSGSQPDMQLCFNIASWANFGCFTLEVPTIVWLFVRVCILFTAAMLCRALIFGG